LRGIMADGGRESKRKGAGEMGKGPQGEQGRKGGDNRDEGARRGWLDGGRGEA
jgi:hypothetical protein